METTKNKMSDFAENFFKKLSKYLDTKLYFFGSIQRADYIPESSDIDVDVFTDNENSTIIKVQNFLGIKRSDIKHFTLYTNTSYKMVSGHKLKYEDKKNNFQFELCIFNEKYKDIVLKDHNFKVGLPFYVSFFLIIIKTLYYRLGILPKPIYYYCKKILMNYMIDGKDQDIIISERNL
jgi:predicted nucleotidyltransferase